MNKYRVYHIAMSWNGKNETFKSSQMSIEQATKRMQEMAEDNPDLIVWIMQD